MTTETTKSRFGIRIEYNIASIVSVLHKTLWCRGIDIAADILDISMYFQTITRYIVDKSRFEYWGTLYTWHIFRGDILRPVIVWENYPRVGLRVETGESQFALEKNLFSTTHFGGTKVQRQTQRINSQQWWDKVQI